jgi:hypothetical protein
MIGCGMQPFETGLEMLWPGLVKPLPCLKRQADFACIDRGMNTGQ